MEIIGIYTVKPLTIESIKKKMRNLANIQDRRIKAGESSAKLSDILVLNYEETKYLLELLGEKI